MVALIQFSLKKLLQITIQFFSGVVWFGSGVFFGSILVAALSLAKASPNKASQSILNVNFSQPIIHGSITDDTVLHDKMSEIQKPKSALPNIDHGVKRLAQIQSRYKEKLPSTNVHQKKKYKTVSNETKKHSRSF